MLQQLIEGTKFFQIVQSLGGEDEAIDFLESLEEQGFKVFEVINDGDLEEWCGCAGPMIIKVQYDA